MSSRSSPSGSGARPLTIAESRWVPSLSMLLLAVAAPLIVTSVFRTTPAMSFQLPELVYLAAVLLVARLGRIWPAALSTLISAAFIRYYFLEPAESFVIDSVEDAVGLIVFLALGFALAATVAKERATRERAQRAHLRLAFIAGANDILSRARLDYVETMDRLARLVIPSVADWCTVDIVTETEKLETVAFAASDVINPSLVESLRHQSQPRPNAPAGIGAVIREGRAELYERVDEQVLTGIARDQRHLALLRGLKVRSMMKVPLFVRGKPAGALTLASVQRRRRFTHDDLTLAEDLAARASSAIENARLYEERVGAARTLQSSLLPTSLPDVPGLEIAARFSPYGEGDLVGGDFYDVFQRDDGTWIVVVGDVCGKGVEAAVLTGLARHTIRASALADESPADLLRRLNHAILRQSLDRFCTVAIATLRQVGPNFAVTSSTGGHPLPIVVRATGQAEPTGQPGTLLGLFEDVTLSDEQIVLAPGDGIVMYTDGWLDERMPTPERVLADAVKAVGNMTAEAAIDRLEADSSPETKDDRAMVILRVPDGGERGGGKWGSS